MALQSITALSKITLQEASSTVTFSGIPDTYRDLILVCNLFYNSGSDTYSRFELNGDTTTANYKGVYMDTYGGGASGGSTNSNLLEYHQSVSSTTPVHATFQLFDYSATDKHKTAIIRFGAATTMTGAYASRWENNAAVGNLKLVGSVANYLPGSTFALFGRIA